MIEWFVTAESRETGSPLFFSSSQEVDMAEMDDEALTLQPTSSTHAEVEMEVGVTQQIGSEWVRIKATVRVHCQQDDQAITRAAEYTMMRANEFVAGTAQLLRKARQA